MLGERLSEGLICVFYHKTAVEKIWFKKVKIK